MPYPPGIDLIQSGRCPAGASLPMACMYCMSGHILECHYQMSCEEAQCSHLAAYGDDPSDFGLAPDFNIEDLDRSDYLACEICGCSEYDACPGGCA
jgi:hypothetical protein